MSPTFAELPLRSQTIEALHAHGFLAPFAIQEMVLPIALADGDVIGQAKTGTGKTLAFGIPVIERVIAPQDPEWADFANLELPGINRVLMGSAGIKPALKHLHDLQFHPLQQSGSQQR